MGEVVGDYELVADVDVTDDVVNTTGDDGDKLSDEGKPVEDCMGSAEDLDTPTTALNTRGNPGVGVTSGLEVLLETNDDTLQTTSFVFEVVSTVDDACAVEAEVGGDEVFSLDTTVIEDDSGNNPTEAETTEADDRRKAAGGGGPINTERAFAGLIRREKAAVGSRLKK